MQRLPVGIDDFAKIREGNYYFVDKTMAIGGASRQSWGSAAAHTAVPLWQDLVLVHVVLFPCFRPWS